MEKVVIVTWKGAGNFGTALQSFALCKGLEMLNYQVYILESIPQRKDLMNILKYFIFKFRLHYIVYSIKTLFLTLPQKKFARFKNDYYKDVRIFSKRQERQMLETTHCFISGSDQIWNTYYKFDPIMFLSFAEGKKRIAYASSIGAKGIKECYKRDVCNYLLKYNYIGVRENKAVTVLSELTGRTDIQKVLDPTFLLTPNDWQFISKDAEIEISIPDKYIFCYFIGQNDYYETQLRSIILKTQISNVIVIPATENPNFNYNGATFYKDAGPIEFVYLLQHATFVCTDSFHATALSINHSIPFVEFMRFKDNDEQSQNSRIYDVLGHYHLMDRIYNTSNAFLSTIDYKSVQEILEEDRKSSLDFLKNAIAN